MGGATKVNGILINGSSVKATQAESEAGSSNAVWMTPLGVAQAIAAIGSSLVVTADESTDTSCYLTFVNDALGAQAIKTGTNLTFNSLTGLLSATGLKSNSLTAAADSQTIEIHPRDFTIDGTAVSTVTGTVSHSSGQFYGLAISPTYNQSGTAAATDLLINRTETAVGSGNQLLFDFQVGGVSKAYLANTGTLVLSANMYCSAANATIVTSNGDNSTLFVQSRNFTVADVAIDTAYGTHSNSSGTSVGLQIRPTYNQSGTAAATDLLINRTETSVGSGTQRLIDAQVGGATKFNVTSAGAVAGTLFNSLAGNNTLFIQSKGFTVADTGVQAAYGTYSAASGQQNAFAVTPTYNQSGTAAATDLLVNRSETAVGSGAQRLADFQVGGVSKAYITNAGLITGATLNSTGQVLAGTSFITYGGLIAGNAADVTLTVNNVNFTVADNAVEMATGTVSNSSGQFNGLVIKPTYNQSGTAAATDLLINRTETAVGSGIQYFINCQVAGSSKFRIANTGVVDAYYIRSTGNNQTMTLQSRSFASADDAVAMATGTWTHSSGQGNVVAIKPTHNQSGTAAATDLLVNRTETAVGSGNQYLCDFQVGGTSKMRMTTTGVMYLSGNLQVDTIKSIANDTTFTLQNRDFTVADTAIAALNGTDVTNSSGAFLGLALAPTYNQSGTAAATDLYVNRTETAVGSGSQRLIDLQVGGSTKFYVDNTGAIYQNGVLLSSSPSHTWKEKLNGELYTGCIGWFVVPDELDGLDLKEIRIACLGLPTGADIEFDIRKNGTATTDSVLNGDVDMIIGTGQSATNGVYQVGVDTTSTELVGTTVAYIDTGENTLAADDVLYMYITQVGSTFAGADFIAEASIG